MSSNEDNKQLVTIAGTVVNAGTGEPLRKAWLKLSRKDDKVPSIRVAITGADGKFTIEEIPPGTYELNADHDGYVEKSYGEDSTGQGAAVLTLAAGQKMTDLIFRLQKCAVISGRVIDEDGDPVRNVSVEAVQRMTYRGKVAVAPVGESRTNDLGEYRVFDLAPGRYYVRATPSAEERSEARGTSTSDTKTGSDYVATYYPNVADVSHASTIELKAGDEIPSTDLSLVRNRTYKIRGQIVDTTSTSEGQSYAINLMSSDALGLANVKQEMADKTNSFELTGVSPGSYIVIAIGFDEREIVKGFESVDVIDADVDSVKVVIKRGAEIRGRVVMEGGPALPKSLRISLTPKDTELDMEGGGGRVKADGTFEVRGVIDGQFKLGMLSECEECYLKSAKMNGIDLLEKGLHVAGGTPQPLEIVYSSRSGTVSGVVTKDDDLPAVGAKVLLVPELPFREWSGRYKSGATDQYGRFAIQGVAPGGYKAFAFSMAFSQDDSTDFEDPEFIRPFESEGAAMSIDEDGKQTLHLKLISMDASNPSKGAGSLQ
jgi:protocatechuate 3,4-dioxygenase beta subunit